MIIRLPAIVAASSVALVLVASAVRAQSGPVFLGSLGLGDELFHEEPEGVGEPGIYSLPLAPSTLADFMCALDQPCFEFTLEVTETTEDAQLRIGYDTPMRDDNFKLWIIDPNGIETTRTNGNQYSVEALFPNPAVGTWEVRLAPYSAEEAPFRIRAKLEAEPFEPTPNAEGQLLPNLRVFRLWEFGMPAPANPLNGLFPPDDINPPLSVAGIEPVSCSVDEQLGFDGEPADRCLRYSFGLANIGDGVFDIRWEASRTDTEAHQMWQCIEMASGDPVPRPAGEGHFDALHGHWHYKNVVHHELFRVDRSTEPPTLVSTGNGKKIGYSPADQGMPQWDQFVQARPGTSGAQGNCKPGTNNRLGMSRGWGDAYRYQRPGNFVALGNNGDGEYVVTTTADPENVVLETDETDNTAYAHLTISNDGEDVEVHETGLGDSPWDPDKVEYVDWWTR